SASARLLEETARSGEESLRQMAWHAARAQRLAGLCADGAQQMRRMLALELDKRGPEALALARRLQEQAAAAAQVPAPVAPAPDVEDLAPPESAAAEFEFEDDSLSDEPAGPDEPPDGG